jgi:hypothetical protein
VSEAAEEICFNFNNVGAISWRRNSSAGVPTRRVDTRYHFVRKHIVDTFIKIIVVKSCDNNSDVFTEM